jgi:hypothetical protein
MPVVRKLALVSNSRSVKLADLVPAAAALQTQIVRDFAPVWKRPATVTAYARLEDMPIDAWPVIVSDSIPYQAEGIHLDKDGHPFSLVKYGASWTLTSSHEVLEMLGDPMGNRLRNGPSPKPGQGTVRFLVEVCDPSEAKEFAYDIDGVTVSDFYFPSFFDATPTAGKRYSFTDAITAPCTILRGGYISWRERTTNHWWQQLWLGPRPVFKDLGVLPTGANPRRFTDGQTEVPEHVMTPAHDGAVMLAAAQASDDSKTRATQLREQVSAIVAGVQ